MKIINFMSQKTTPLFCILTSCHNTNNMALWTPEVEAARST
jgi:hypothetical protein